MDAEIADELVVENNLLERAWHLKLEQGQLKEKFRLNLKFSCKPESSIIGAIRENKRDRIFNLLAKHCTLFEEQLSEHFLAT